MTVLTNVFRRGGAYYFRTKVPVRIRGLIGRCELWRSLKTSDVHIARKRGVALHALTEQLWFALNRSMSPQESQALVDAWLKAELDRDTDVRLTADLDAIAAHETLVLRRGPSSGNAYYNPAEAERLADELIAAHGLVLAETDRELTVRLMRRAHAELFKAVSDRARVSWYPWSEDDPAAELLARVHRPSGVSQDPLNSVPMAASSERCGMTVEQAAEAFLAEEARGGLSAGRQKEFRAAYNSFQEWLGEQRDLADITATVAGNYRLALSRMPASGATRPEYRDLSFLGRLELAERVGELRLLSPATIGGNYINPLRSLFDWAKGLGKITVNPFATIRPPRESKKVTRKDRDTFTVEQLVALFSLPLFTGAAGARGKPLYKPGNVRVDDWRFWLPLVALFSGARLNEICGLELADIDAERGVAFFHVRPNSTRGQVKTEAGVRRVPIHPTLIELGLLRRVAALRSAGEVALFPELRPGPRGYLSDLPSKFFADLIDRALGNSAAVVFHSFRHTFITGLRSARVEPLLRMAIVGHDPGDTHESYGDQDIVAMGEAVSQVTFNGLDLGSIAR